MIFIFISPLYSDYWYLTISDVPKLLHIYKIQMITIPNTQLAPPQPNKPHHQFNPIQFSSISPLDKQESPHPEKNKIGHWTVKENAKYYAFLTKFQEKFEGKQMRRHWKVFKSLADFMKSRDPNQCRSHHHKMKKDFTSIDQILKFLRNKQPGLLPKSSKYFKMLENMDFNDFGNDINSLASTKNFNHTKIEENLCQGMQKISNFNSNFWDQLQNFDDLQEKDLEIKKTSEEYNIKQSQRNLQKEFIPDFSAPSYLGLYPHFNYFSSRPYKNGNQTHRQTGGFWNNSLGTEGIETKRRQKVLQCHYYFNKWRQAMEDLMNINQNRPMSENRYK